MKVLEKNPSDLKQASDIMNRRDVNQGKPLIPSPFSSLIIVPSVVAFSPWTRDGVRTPKRHDLVNDEIPVILED